MAKAILMRGGGGGVKSDDVTATKGHVLRGYTALTTDSDDEPTEGTIQIVDTSEDNYSKTRTSVFGIDLYRLTMYMHLPQGNAYYIRPDGMPHVEIDANQLGDARPEHLIQGMSATSKSGLKFGGSIPVRGYHGPDSSESWLYPAEGGYVVRLKEGYYHKDESGYEPYVIVPTALAKQAVNYHPEKTLGDTVTCNERGHINIIDTGANNYKSNMSGAYGIDYGRGTFFIDLAHGNAYYVRGDGQLRDRKSVV